MPDVKVDTFPRTKSEALAMLYVQNQDLTELSPVQILEMYEGAYKEIREHIKEQWEHRYNEI